MTDRGTESDQSFPERIGDFRILRVLGRGGMGIVFEAEQDKPRRRVAIKVVRGAGESAEGLRRFELEAQVLGRLRHAGIATVFGAGTHRFGSEELPYFVMERIHGVSLTRFVKERELDLREKLALVLKICDAVEHAHQHGVIHRDLKPDNILIEEESAQPKVLDFGLARVTDSDIKASTQVTSYGQIMGTLPYMSPEQALGDPSQLDARSDVYSLGVVTYELLAGHRPYVIGPGALEALRVIREEDPRPLSTWGRQLGGDLETILGKALEKDLARRYASVAVLRDDIQRYLRDQPISARPPSAFYQLRKFARRNRALVGGLTGVFVALVVGTVVSILFAVKESAQRRMADRALADVERVAQFQDDMIARMEPQEMGRRLLEDVRDRIGRVRGAPGADDEGGAALESLSEALVGVNLTDVAVRVIDESLLAPSLAALDEEFGAAPELDARLRAAVASAYETLGLEQQALEPLRQARQTYIAALGPEHERTLEVSTQLGELLRKLGHLDEAEELLVSTAQTLRRLRGEDHPDLLTCQVALASLAWNRARYEQAEAQLLELLERSRANHDPSERRILQGLALVYDEMRRPEAAEPYAREALELLRAEQDNLETVKAEAMLAGLLLRQGKADEADPLFRDALARAEQAFGDEHSVTIGLVSQVAWLDWEQGKPEAALSGWKRALELNRRLFGAGHPDTLVSMNNVGFWYSYHGQWEAARELFLEVVRGQRGLYAADHPERATALCNLANACIRLGRAEEAVAPAEEAVEIRRASLGEDHPKTLDAMVMLSSAHMMLGRQEEVRRLLEEVVERAVTRLPEDWKTGDYFLRYGLCLQQLGLPAEAEDAFREAYARLSEHGAPEPAIGRARSALIGLYESTGRTAEASALRERED